MSEPAEDGASQGAAPHRTPRRERRVSVRQRARWRFDPLGPWVARGPADGWMAVERPADSPDTRPERWRPPPHLDRPSLVKHTIRVGATAGAALSSDRRSITLRTLEDLDARMPVEARADTPSTHICHLPVRRFELQLRTSLDDDSATARCALAESIVGHPRVLEEPKHRAFGRGCGDAWTDAQGWVRAVKERRVETRDDFQLRVEEALDQVGLGAPMPVRVLRSRPGRALAPAPGAGEGAASPDAPIASTGDGLAAAEGRRAG